ncbi:hypothetical protein GSQ54_09255 [Clostridioides difficile]|nr:hypothetical protein [Clostridioides difficile]NJI80637.1 hypothetical protein [Clostridioides difficile]NJJ36687.1 hypothetical protein [Clostridioides difficile]NJK15940.1 hypothetical protein [Clostridioides difficile]
MNLLYNFLLNMWKIGNIDEKYLNTMSSNKIITSKERDMIVSTSKINVKGVDNIG